MPHSLRVKLKNLQRKGELTDKDIDRIFKALEQEPMPTMVYPQVEGITPTVVCEVTKSQEPSGETVSLEVFKQVMWERDIAIEQLKELGYGFGQKIESCDDAISRQAVLDLAKLDGRKGLGTIIHAFDVEQLPSVNPQEPKTGHWIEKDGFDGDVYYDCSECGESWSTIEGTPWDNGMKYCPNCGCRMIEPQESEDKDETDD